MKNDKLSKDDGDDGFLPIEANPPPPAPAAPIGPHHHQVKPINNHHQTLSSGETKKEKK